MHFFIFVFQKYENKKSAFVGSKTENWGTHVSVQCIAVNARFSLAIFKEERC
jgi:hypothetical protein